MNNQLIMLHIFLFATIAVEASSQHFENLKLVNLNVGELEAHIKQGIVQFNRDGKWGTICSDGFGQVAARVACRQLGFSFEGATSGTVQFNSNQNETSVIFTKVKCRGGESNLKDCSVQNLKNESKCESSKAVYLDCSTADLSHGSDNIRLSLPVADGVGLVEIRNGSKWELVCSTNFSAAAASIACKQLGYQYANAVPVPRYLLANSKQRFDRPRDIRGLVCNGNETTLNECRTSNCQTDQVTISCVGNEIENANDSQKLLIAIAQNNATEVDRLLKSGLSANTMIKRCCGERSQLGYRSDAPVLECAICYGSYGSVQALVRHGANLSNHHLYVYNTVLSLPIENEDFEMIKFLIENGANIPKNQNTLTNLVASTGNVEIAEYFDQRGVNFSTNNDVNLLRLAAENGHIDMVRFLIAHGSDMEAKGWNGMTAVAYAANAGHLEVVRYLADMGADLGVISQQPLQTLLMFAVENQDMEMVMFLVSRGVNVNVIGSQGKSAIAIAVEKGNFEIVNFLISNGADLARMHGRANSLLTSAIIGGNLEMVKYVVELGSNVNASTTYRYSPLILASKGGLANIVKYLIDQGASLNAVDSENHTALANAVEHFQVVKVLVDNGADVNARSSTGENPLMLACQKGTLETVKYLVEHGADVNAQKQGGKTALMFACWKGDLEMVKYLVGNGANINAETFDKATPLVFAQRFANSAVVNYLIENGAVGSDRPAYGMPSLRTRSPEYIDTSDGHTDPFQKRRQPTLFDNVKPSNLTLAAETGNLEMAKYAIQQGAAIDNDLNLVISMALFYSNTEVASYLDSICNCNRDLTIDNTYYDY